MKWIKRQKQIALWLLFIASLIAVVVYTNPREEFGPNDKLPTQADVILWLCVWLTICNLLYLILIKPQLGMPWLFLGLYTSYYWGQCLYSIYQCLEPESMPAALNYSAVNYFFCLFISFLGMFIYNRVIKIKEVSS